MRLVTFTNTRKNGPKRFSIVKKAFFSDDCLYRPLLSRGNDRIICILYVKLPCGLFKDVPWLLSCSTIGEKRPKHFLRWNFCLFSQNFVFATTSYVLKNWSFYFHSKRQTTSWTLINCSVSFFMLDNTRKNWPIIFFHWKACLFLQKLCFQQPLRSEETSLVSSTV